MNEEISDQCVVLTRLAGNWRWYRSNRDLWVLDTNKWRNEFINHGHDVPEFLPSFRFGFLVVDERNAEPFLNTMTEQEVTRESLAIELAHRYRFANSWWDVADIFPIAFVDFDHRHVAAFYPDGVAMERYVPDGWTGEFVDFANEYPENLLPTEEKFWIRDGVDLLALLNARARQQQNI